MADTRPGDAARCPYLRAATDAPPPAGLSAAPVGRLGDRPVELVYDPARHHVVVALGTGTCSAGLRAAVRAFGMDRRWPELAGVEVWIRDRIGDAAASLASHVGAQAAPARDRTR